MAHKNDYEIIETHESVPPTKIPADSAPKLERKILMILAMAFLAIIIYYIVADEPEPVPPSTESIIAPGTILTGSLEDDMVDEEAAGFVSGFPNESISTGGGTTSGQTSGERTSEIDGSYNAGGGTVGNQ